MKMKVSLDRMVTIIACMYSENAEVVNDITNEECYLFLGIFNNRLTLYYEEINCLIDNEIIELDCGCDEKGYETEVYRLTENSHKRIQEIIKTKKNKKMLSLKE